MVFLRDIIGCISQCEIQHWKKYVVAFMFIVFKSQQICF